MRRQRGFSLLEVIIAFVLLAGAMGLLLAILGGGLAQVRQAGQASEAALHAQSLLAEVGVLEPIRPGRRSGEIERGRYRWTLSVSEVPDPLPPPDDEAAGELVETVGLQPVGQPVVYLLELDIAWGDGEGQRRLRLSSLRTRYPEAAAP
jgi:general secretion pathway protein I